MRKYGSGILEIIIRDGTGMKLDHFTMNLADKKLQMKIFNIIGSKYGIEFSRDGFFDF